MRYTIEADRDTVALEADLSPVVSGLGFALVELDLYRTRKSARVRLVVTGAQADSDGAPEIRERGGEAPENRGPAHPPAIGTEDLARIHRAVLPRLELALGGDSSGGKSGTDIYVEVSSPGLDRLIRDGKEFRRYKGRPVRCYLAGASGWRRGILRGADGEQIMLETEEGTITVKYEHIAKARLDG
ncbi:MAG: ribosome assembly cofactor RimP [Treponema sp.]|jgi:ribosome maturation factor RimP|nr:ribosome assembly cofactor RimP [Treponema sp.]